MEPDSPEPTALASPITPTTRHDGWTGDKMAIFCESLADTAVVAEACDQANMGISGAYALRRRNAFFAGLAAAPAPPSLRTLRTFAPASRRGRPLLPA